jgi:hypothetical protein
MPPAPPDDDSRRASPARRTSPPRKPPPPLPPSPSRADITAHLRGHDWSWLSRELTLYANKRMRWSDRETAAQIAQDAICKCLDPAYAEWDPSTRPDLFDFLGHLVNGLVANHFKRLRRAGKHVAWDDEQSAAPDADKVSPADQLLRREKEPAPDETALVRAPMGATPEAIYASREEASRATAALGKLGERIADDTVCLRLVELMRKGVDKPAAQAKELGVDVYEVHKAKKRLAGHVRGVASDLGLDQEKCANQSRSANEKRGDA